jgi:phage baseplate assembly protein W
MTMGKDFLGRGLRFPIVPDETGALGYTFADENVEQSLRILLQTRIGERMMRGDFGTRIPDLLFSPGSEQNLRALEREVENAVTHWEARVELLDVTAEQDRVDPNRVTVAISYRVIRSNTRDSVVFPFYLRTEGAR